MQHNIINQTLIQKKMDCCSPTNSFIMNLIKTHSIYQPSRHFVVSGLCWTHCLWRGYGKLFFSRALSTLTFLENTEECFCKFDWTDVLLINHIKTVWYWVSFFLWWSSLYCSQFRLWPLKLVWKIFVLLN